MSFPVCDTLRPTPNRIRETLFNWLDPFIQNADCLDLFAGSGALSFEALSRGAHSAVCVDADSAVIASLKQNQKHFNASHLEIIQAKILEKTLNFTMPFTHRVFDIIFVDPPFHQNLVKPTCTWIYEKGYLKPGGFLYIETELADDDLPQTLEPYWEMLKTKKTATIRYSLYKSNRSIHLET